MPPPRMLPPLVCVVALALLSCTALAAQLPAVRLPAGHPRPPLPAPRRPVADVPALPARSVRRGRRALPAPLRLPAGHRDTAAVVPARGAAAARRLASRLLRTAASHKDRSLRDVLDDNAAASPGARSTLRVRTAKLLFDPARDASPDPARRDYHATADKRARRAVRTSADEHAARRQPADAMLAGLAARLYPADANESELLGARGRSLSLTLDDEDYFTGDAPKEPEPEPELEEEEEEGEGGQRNGEPPRAERVALERALASLRSAQAGSSPTRAAAALRAIQELCHSLHHGAALAASEGGVACVLHALDDATRPVRAAAAWAVATCAQNNPSVQRAALAGDALPKLARLVLGSPRGGGSGDDRAMRRRDVVRGRALFAINALLGCEEARRQFERMPAAAAVVARGLADMGDVRAMRRALNVAEVLVRRNARKWRGVLERSDVSVVIERLMLEHEDIDVRESAARIIAALDGRVVVG